MRRNPVVYYEFCLSWRECVRGRFDWRLFKWSECVRFDWVLLDVCLVDYFIINDGLHHYISHGIFIFVGYSSTGTE